jgi:ribosomal-protein-alanine N-acetyltransferase
MTFEIKPMGRSHLDQVAELEKTCFSMPWSHEMFENEIKNRHAVYYVAVIEEEGVVGYIGMHVIFEEGYIMNLATAPGLRRRGIARALLGKAIDYCRSRGLSYITLEVRESNDAAISLYESFGFRAISMRAGYYRDPPENALVMFLAL